MIKIVIDDQWSQPPTRADAWSSGSFMHSWDIFAPFDYVNPVKKWLGFSYNKRGSIRYNGSHIIVPPESMFWVRSQPALSLQGLISLKKGLSCLWSGYLVFIHDPEGRIVEKVLFLQGLSTTDLSGHIVERRSVESKKRLLARVDLDGVFENIVENFSVERYNDE